MAQKGSFLSRFKGVGKVQAPERPEHILDEPEQPLQAVPEPEPPQPVPDAPREPAELHLEPEHPLYQLWQAYARCVPDAPPPCLSLEPLVREGEKAHHPAGAARPNEPDVPLTPKEAEADLKKLAQAVEQAAGKRLAELREREAAARRTLEELAAKEAKRAAQAGTEPPPAPKEPAPPNMDADFQFFFTARGMGAWLLVYPPSGKGLPLDKKLLKRALESSGVCFGADSKLLNSLPERPDRYFTLHLIARGEMPVHGKDGSVIDLFSRRPIHTVKEDESGRVDFASVEIFQSAQEGEMICRIIQPTPEKDGRTVLGQLVPARKGSPPPIPRGRNTEVSEDGGSLIASCGGHVEFGGSTFQIKPVLEIRSNVDFSTGNIKSVGDVHIFGDVRSGFLVKATGSITIEGVVEASTIEAGGDLMVRKGVQGSGEAVLRSQRSILVKYMESCQAFARESLEAESLVSCKVYCDKDVTVRSGKGVIMGGETHAGHDVSANIVGTRSEVPTAIALGGRPFEEMERALLERSLKELEDKLEKLDRQPDSPAKLQKMSKTRMLIAANHMKQRQLEKDVSQLEREEGEAGKKPSHGRLSCSLLYPGAEITIGSCFLRVEHETHSCMTSVKDGEISLI